jgi:hypothetical protein
MTDGDIRLKEAFVLDQRDDSWRPSRWGLPTQGRLPWFPPVAIIGNGVGRASRSVVRKGYFCPSSLEIAIARREVHHLTIYTTQKLKHPFKIHVWDSAMCARRLGPFAPQAAQHPTHCELGLGPHVNNADLPSVAG